MDFSQSYVLGQSMVDNLNLTNVSQGSRRAVIPVVTDQEQSSSFHDVSQRKSAKKENKKKKSRRRVPPPRQTENKTTFDIIQTLLILILITQLCNAFIVCFDSIYEKEYFGFFDYLWISFNILGYIGVLCIMLILLSCEDEFHMDWYWYLGITFAVVLGVIGLLCALTWGIRRKLNSASKTVLQIVSVLKVTIMFIGVCYITFWKIRPILNA